MPRIFPALSPANTRVAPLVPMAMRPLIDAVPGLELSYEFTMPVMSSSITWPTSPTMRYVVEPLIHTAGDVLLMVGETCMGVGELALLCPTAQNRFVESEVFVPPK